MIIRILPLFYLLIKIGSLNIPYFEFKVRLCQQSKLPEKKKRKINSKISIVYDYYDFII